MDAKYDNIKTAPTIISHTETGVYASQRSLAQNTSDILSEMVEVFQSSPK